MGMKTQNGHLPLSSAWFFMVLSGSRRCKRGTPSSGSEEHAARWRQLLGQQNGMMTYLKRSCEDEKEQMKCAVGRSVHCG